MFEIFKNLRPFQSTEYIFLVLISFFIPISWRIASYAMIGLFVSTILKGVFENGFKINPLQYKNKPVYIFFIAFWILYALSFLYSDNTAEARIQIGKKLPFFLFPLFFLCSDLSYLTKERVRTLMYCLVLGILSLYAINLVWAIIDISFNDDKITRLTNYHKFFKTSDRIFTYLHRAHFSLFTCLALVFSFVEFFDSKSHKIRIFNLVIIFIMIMSPFYITSRAGILCEILVLFTLWIWLTFIRKERKLGIITGVLFVLMLLMGYFAFPKTIDRFSKAINMVKDGKGDIRLTLRSSCRSAIRDNYLFGAGAGDRCDETLKAHITYREYIISQIKPTEDADLMDFERNRETFLDSIDARFENDYTKEVYEYAKQISEVYDCDYSSVKQYLAEYQRIDHTILHELNAHNQFSDTIIAVGIIGLILLLGFFIAPVYLWIKNKNFDIVFFSLLFIIVFNCLFESVFERQMGIMFFVFFYFLLFHANFCQQTNDN